MRCRAFGRALVTLVVPFSLDSDCRRGLKRQVVRQMYLKSLKLERFQCFDVAELAFRYPGSAAAPAGGLRRFRRQAERRYPFHGDDVFGLGVVFGRFLIRYTSVACSGAGGYLEWGPSVGEPPPAGTCRRRSFRSRLQRTIPAGVGSSFRLLRQSLHQSIPEGSYGT